MTARAARIAVRRAGRDDLDAIVAMRLALLEASRGNAAHGRLRRDISADARRLFAAQLQDPRCLTLVAMAGRERVGVLRCVLSVANPLYAPARHAYIASAYVLPAHRRRGVLGRLVRRAAAWCRERGISELRLHAGVENRAAAAAWKALGFEPAEVLYVRPGGRRRATTARAARGSA